MHGCKFTPLVSSIFVQARRRSYKCAPVYVPWRDVVLGAAAADDLALDVPGDLWLGVALHVAHQREGRGPLRHRLALVRRVEGYRLCKGENMTLLWMDRAGKLKEYEVYSNVLLSR